MRFGRQGLGLAAIVMFVWAIADSQFRNPEGFLTGRAVFPIAGGVGLLVLLVASIAGALRSGAWIALALIGQAAALQLIEAGATVRYQHYVLPEMLFSKERVGFLAILAVQAVGCAVALVPLWPAVRAWARATFSTLTLVCTSVVFILASAALSRSPSAYAVELMLATVIQLVALINVVIAVLALPEDALHAFWRSVAKVLGPEWPASSAGERNDRFALVPAIIVTVAAAILSVAAYERHPHIPDEVAYLLNAKYFAAGMLYMSPPPVHEAFDVDLMHLTATQWYSSMPPGWPAILAIGARMNVAWLVNPLLAGINVILAYVFFREMYPRRTARLALLLLSASPWLVFMGMNFMTHTLSLSAALCAAIAVSRLIRTGRLRWAWIGGVAIGALSLIRPLEGLFMAILLGLWALTSSGLRRRLLATGMLASSSIAVGALTLPYNKVLTGRMTELPLAAYASTHYPSGSNDLGFGPNRGWGWTGLDPFPGHDAIDAVINAGLNLFAVNVELFGWATGSLVFVLVLFSGKLERSDYRMLAAILGVVCMLSLYWFSGGPDFGARYWFLMIVPLAALSARGIEVAGAARERTDSSELTLRGARTLAVALVLCGVALATFFPWRAIDKYHHYRGMRPDVRELAKRHSFRGSLVLIQGKRHPDFASAAAYEPPRIDADLPVYAWARTPEIAGAAIAAFPDRPVWVLQGPTITGLGYRVVRRPE